jgi:DNA primase
MSQKPRDKFMEMEREEIVRTAKEELLRGVRGKEALNYLKNTRKISDAVIDEFNVGYCPPEVKHQVCGRIITPIYDTDHTLVALSTRHLDKNHPQRFWHESFDKGSYLYALNYAKYDIRLKNKVVLVEGEFDVMVLHSHGFKMAVGVLGSSLTLFQIALLSRYCSEFYLLFDGDNAGRATTERVMGLYREKNIKNYGIQFIPVYLPDGDDPDDFLLREGVKGLREKFVSSKDSCLNF